MQTIISQIVYSETITKTVTKDCPYVAFLIRTIHMKPVLVVLHEDADGTQGVAAFVVENHNEAHAIATRICDALTDGGAFDDAAKGE